MADLTQEIELTTSWKNIVSEGSLTAGESYVGDLGNASIGATAFQALTDDATAPTVKGHPWRPLPNSSDVPTRRLSVTTGINIWMRLNRGTATLILSKA